MGPSEAMLASFDCALVIRRGTCAPQLCLCATVISSFEFFSLLPPLVPNAASSMVKQYMEGGTAYASACLPSREINHLLTSGSDSPQRHKFINFSVLCQTTPLNKWFTGPTLSQIGSAHSNTNTRPSPQPTSRNRQRFLPYHHNFSNNA